MLQKDWIVAFSITILPLAIAEVGYTLGERSSSARNEDRRRHIGAISSIMLGLLSLLLGFSFSMALERYTVRRNLVVKEANAIGTAWLRAGLLPEPRVGRSSDCCNASS